MRLFLLFLALIGTAMGLTEKEAVLLALSNSPDVKIHAFALEKDSLTLKTAESDRGLQIILSGDRLLDVHPARRESYSVAAYDTTIKTASVNLNAAAFQPLPGGGRLQLGAHETAVTDLHGSGTDHSAGFSFSLSQPLLKGGWGYSDTDYRITLERNNYKISQSRFVDDLRDILSTVRTGYWDWVYAERTTAIRVDELAYADNQLKNVRTQFTLGEKSEMDTLTAALERLNASEALLSAEYAARKARETLSLKLGSTPEALIAPDIPDSVPMTLPSMAVMLESARKSSGTLSMYELTARNLDLEMGRQSNALLPALDVEAGLSVSRQGDKFLGAGASSAVSPVRESDPYIGIGFTWNLLSQGTRLIRESAAKSAASNRIEKELYLRQLESDLRNLRDAWQEDSASLTIRAAEIAIAEKAYAQAQKGYELGTVDNLALIKAKNDLISARLKKLSAVINLKKVEIAVDQSTGCTLEKFGVTTP